MATNTALSEIIDMTRAEAGLSLDRSSGRNQIDQLKHIIKRTQTFLFRDFDWPQFRVRRFVTLAQGQRVYSFPDDMDFENITSANVFAGSDSCEVDFGITDEEALRRELGTPDLPWPVRKWDSTGFNPDGVLQFEVYPTPDRAAKLMFKGLPNLPRFVDDTDRAVLDDQLIAMFAAVEWLSEKQPTRAQTKQTMAQQYYTKLKLRNGSTKRQPTSMGLGQNTSRARPDRDYVV